jgi:hypothetical protein
VGGSRTGEDREADALVAQIAQLRAQIGLERERRAATRSASEQEEIAALRERITAAKAFVAKQSNGAVGVEARARRTRFWVGIVLSVLGVGLTVSLWRMLRDNTEEGLGYFYLIFGLPLLMGVVLILQSRYSAFRNGSLDPEDDS